LIPALYVNYFLILGSGFKRKIIPSLVRSEIKHAQQYDLKYTGGKAKSELEMKYDF